MEHTDAEIIRRCLAGEPDLYQILVQRYERPLLAYLIHRLHDREQAREAAQETLVRAYFKLAKLERPEAFHSWLIGIGARVSLEIFRNRTRSGENLAEIMRASARTDDAAEEYRLDEAIATLPPGQRQVILLRYYEELSCQEIADRIRVPLGTVTKTLSRAYAALREELETPLSGPMEVSQ